VAYLASKTGKFPLVKVSFQLEETMAQACRQTGVYLQGSVLQSQQHPAKQHPADFAIGARFFGQLDQESLRQKRACFVEHNRKIRRDRRLISNADWRLTAMADERAWSLVAMFVIHYRHAVPPNASRQRRISGRYSENSVLLSPDFFRKDSGPNNRRIGRARLVDLLVLLSSGRGECEGLANPAGTQVLVYM
jgi:hypothetical protein